MTIESKAYNMDCMEGMKSFPDKHFDLAIVDPPYGLGDRLIKGGAKGGMGSLKNLADNKVGKWDKIPDKEYFIELKRVSKKQIIWGGNYFLDFLGSSDGMIVWDKMNGTNPMADAEIAWKSFGGTTRMFRMHHFSAGYEKKTHPTQKPVKLYEWLLNNYAICKECNGCGEVPSLGIDCDVQTCKKCKGNAIKILDTHLGSGSSRIAADKLGFDFIGYELDKEYFDAQEKRYKEFKSQVRMEF